MYQVRRVVVVPIDVPPLDAFCLVDCRSLAEANGALKANCKSEREILAVVIVEWVQDARKAIPPLRLPLRLYRAVADQIDLDQWIITILQTAARIEDDVDKPDVPIDGGIDQVFAMHPWLTYRAGDLLAG